MPPGPAPREVLLQAVASDECLAEFSSQPVQVVTTGPDTAIAIYADGAAVAWARVSGSEIAELKVLR
ncbi:hypothetical protein LWC34_27095 [Kibdelosporangium philippinense]|uniref:Uncharacterized protein n=1 Tax=Kibdelosporangium philippinense TaxID=211113 RepID=A0ABS8ZG09_9PSEU|nr:hypothetical protein [Kibdelosporangium philippinense]MCE7006467.1 hypothetical protein [Kibdelosporangium philippinense]